MLSGVKLMSLFSHSGGKSQKELDENLSNLYLTVKMDFVQEITFIPKSNVEDKQNFDARSNHIRPVIRRTQNFCMNSHSKTTSVWPAIMESRQPSAKNGNMTVQAFLGLPASM